MGRYATASETALFERSIRPRFETASARSQARARRCARWMCRLVLAPPKCWLTALSRHAAEPLAPLHRAGRLRTFDVSAWAIDATGDQPAVQCRDRGGNRQRVRASPAAFATRPTSWRSVQETWAAARRAVTTLVGATTRVCTREVCIFAAIG